MDLTANWGTVKSAFQEPGPDPQSIGGQFGTLSGFLRTILDANEPKNAPNIFQTEKFQDYF